MTLSRLGILDEFTATARLDRVWWHIRDHKPRDRAEELIWEGTACYELEHFVETDVTDRALALLDEADRFIPEAAMSGRPEQRGKRHSRTFLS